MARLSTTATVGPPIRRDLRLFLLRNLAIRGKPRTINNLALAALIATYAASKNLVDESAARAAVTEIIATE